MQNSDGSKRERDECLNQDPKGDTSCEKKWARGTEKVFGRDCREYTQWFLRNNHLICSFRRSVNGVHTGPVRSALTRDLCLFRFQQYVVSIGVWNTVNNIIEVLDARALSWKEDAKDNKTRTKVELVDWFWKVCHMLQVVPNRGEVTTLSHASMQPGSGHKNW